MVVNGCVKGAISNQNKSFKRELDRLVVKKITDFIPQKALEINSDFSNFVELADSNFNVPGKIDLLLGANIFYELLKPERIKIKDSQLLLVNSVFGYTVTGNLDSINETKVHCGLIRDEDLNKTLETFWKVEEVEEPIIKNKERLICEEHYANTHFRTKEGKYVVSMPLKKEPSCLVDVDEEANFPIAASVLRNNLYMDDVLCGAATLEEAIVLRQQLKGILKSVGMELHKLCASHEKLSPDPEQNYNFATLTDENVRSVVEAEPRLLFD
ncbi:uncharacterized protein TNCV_2599341 [Trichonephila clavipes]|uniref:Peptidase aspartic putative domain-containing protein n=1 Tax=Trichonephila clavipes TaxID=2585209 RepID=A0A8X6RJ74_TRICX|nr:uncharacterized protein TNCV_2599341 [Trichonephila clavipes]